MKTKYIVYLIFTLLLGNACSDFLEVVPVSNVTEGEIFSDITRAQQFLNPAYAGVPFRPEVGLDHYTDNSVDNDGPISSAITGGTAESSPVESEWANAIRMIMQINEFLEKGLDVPYDAFEPETSEALKKRIRGEAYGLRGYYKWLMLKNFAGPSADDPSVMLGIPILDKLIDMDEANSISRSTYMESYNSITADLDSAMVLVDIMRYDGAGDFDGIQFTGRISGEMILALKARMALFASSEAFQQISKAEAANIIYNSIKVIDEEMIVELQPFGNFDNINNPDNLWRTRFESTGWYENSFYPPSMYGDGDCNPSQNLVDAFPDFYGFPITNSQSIYDPENPYQGRDPRMERFIFHNGQNDFRSAYVEVYEGGRDAIGGITKRATRTGYFMKKFLSETINLNPDESGQTSTYKNYPVFTRAGLYLDFAEAAVEAYGVEGKGTGMAFSAKDAIAAVRTRGGLILDDYLDIATQDVNLFRELIRNERRIEFCFEGERYYDVRRWKLPLAEMNKPLMGMGVTKLGDDQFAYSVKEVEKRNFKDYMYYNPIPREEVLRSDALVQNHGWE